MGYDMRTYKVYFDGFCFTVELTEEESQALAQDDGIEVIPA